MHVELVPAQVPQTWLHLSRGGRIDTWERVERAATVWPELVCTERTKAEVGPVAEGFYTPCTETPY